MSVYDVKVRIMSKKPRIVFRTNDGFEYVFPHLNAFHDFIESEFEGFVEDHPDPKLYPSIGRVAIHYYSDEEMELIFEGFTP